MKKKIIFIILLGVLLCILFLIPKETYQKIFNRSSKPSENNYKENILKIYKKLYWKSFAHVLYLSERFSYERKGFSSI